MMNSIVGYFEWFKKNEFKTSALLRNDRHGTISLIDLNFEQELSRYNKPTNLEDCYYNIKIHKLYEGSIKLCDVIPLFMQYNKSYPIEEFEKKLKDTVKAEFQSKSKLIKKVQCVINARESVTLSKYLCREEEYLYQQYLRIDLDTLYKLLDVVQRHRNHISIILSREYLAYIVNVYRFVRFYLYEKGLIHDVGTSKISKEIEVSKCIRLNVTCWKDLVILKTVGDLIESNGDFEMCTVVYNLPNEDSIKEVELDNYISKWSKYFVRDGLRTVYERLSKSNKKVFKNIKADCLNANIIYRPNSRKLLIDVKLKSKELDLNKE